VLLLFFLWLLLAVVLSIFNIKYCVSILIAFRLLVPYSSFSIFGIPIEFNYILLLCFLIFLLKQYLKKEVLSIIFIKPFALFSLLVFISSLFATSLPFSQQLGFLRTFIISNFLLPIIIWQSFKNEKDIKLLINTLIICLFVMCIYGFYCFYISSNPYVAYLSIIFGTIDLNSVFADVERGGIIGKVQSTTFHPFLWNVILCISLFAVSISLGFKKRKLLCLFLIVILLGNLLISGTRSGLIACLSGFMLLVLFLPGRLKVYSSLFFVLILIVGLDTSIFGKYQPIADSILFFNNQEKNIGGSSLDMRLEQFNGAIDLWNTGGYIFGNGFGWCNNYYAVNGDHPVLLAFESIIYTALIDNGILGICIWSYLFIYLFLLNHRFYCASRRFYKRDYWIINSFIFSYLVYILITGVFGLNIFLVFLTLIFKQSKIKLDLLNDY
jgi:hypothetical protein